MLKKSRIALIAGLALLPTAVIANQILGFYPIVGSGSYCASTTNNVCTSTIPAGPVALIGNETILGETNLSGGQNPQGILIPSGLLGNGSLIQSSPKNLFRNGDISVNPFQSGTSQAADIANTVTTSADGFRVVGGASSAINWSQQTGATDIVAGQFTASLRFQRKAANADTAQICQISVLTSQESVALQGQKFVYSFWAKAGANLSSTNGGLTVKVASGTGTNDTSANFKAGSWAGYVDDITASNSSSPVSFPTSVATGVATLQTLPAGATATWTQYWVSGTIPATATQVGTEICITPIGTAGANDWFETSNHQLEVVTGSIVTPSSFEHHTAQYDLSQAQRFFWRLNSVSGAFQGSGACTATNVDTIPIFLPVQMRSAPTATITAGAWQLVINGAAATGITGQTMGTSTVNNVTVSATTACTAGQTVMLTSNGTTGIINATAEL